MRFVSKHVLLPVPFGSRRILRHDPREVGNVDCFHDGENFIKSRFFRKFLFHQLKRKELYLYSYLLLAALFHRNRLAHGSTVN